MFIRAAAIVKGAVAHGAHMHETGGNSTSWGIVQSRKARYHYGITVSEPFRPNIHPLNKLFMDPWFGIPMCGDRMKWLIRKVGYRSSDICSPLTALKKGENMRQGVGISSDFRRRCPVMDSEATIRQLLVFDETIYVSADDIAPEDVEQKRTLLPPMHHNFLLH